MLLANDRRERIASVVAVAGLHIALGYVFLTGLGASVLRDTAERLKVFDVTEEPPLPAIEEAAEEQRTPEPEGAAAPPALKARPAEVAAPPATAPLPSPVIAAPIAGPGTQNAAGAAAVPGPGTGAGGIGTGTGSGGRGPGTGGGGAATKPRLLSGSIVNADYPRAAYRARAEGTVIASYRVGTDGRATRCRIVESSGNADLDSTTCRLIEARFRYEPARDAAGEPVTYLTGWKQTWWLEGRR